VRYPGLRSGKEKEGKRKSPLEKNAKKKNWGMRKCTKGRPRKELIYSGRAKRRKSAPCQTKIGPKREEGRKELVIRPGLTK